MKNTSHDTHQVGKKIKEPRKRLSHLRYRKAAGPDDIQNIVLKHLLLPALKIIATIYKASITNNYFPSQ
jgi:hypothetical protein